MTLFHVTVTGLPKSYFIVKDIYEMLLFTAQILSGSAERLLWWGDISDVSRSFLAVTVKKW